MFQAIALCMTALTAAEEDASNLLQARRTVTQGALAAQELSSWVDRFSQSPESTIERLEALGYDSQRSLLQQLQSVDVAVLAEKLDSMPQSQQGSLPLLLRQMSLPGAADKTQPVQWLSAIQEHSAVVEESLNAKGSSGGVESSVGRKAGRVKTTTVKPSTSSTTTSAPETSIVTSVTTSSSTSTTSQSTTVSARTTASTTSTKTSRSTTTTKIATTTTSSTTIVAAPTSNYEIGEAGDHKCPTGYRIMTKEDCIDAAVELGLAVGGEDMDEFSEIFAKTGQGPRGCYFGSDQETCDQGFACGGANKVYFEQFDAEPTADSFFYKAGNQNERAQRICHISKCKYCLATGRDHCMESNACMTLKEDGRHQLGQCSNVHNGMVTLDAEFANGKSYVFLECPEIED